MKWIEISVGIVIILLSGCGPKPHVEIEGSSKSEARAIQEFQSGKYDRAIQLLSGQTQSAVGEAYLGLAYIKKKNFDMATKILKKANARLSEIKDHELCGQVLFAWGICQDEKQNFDAAYTAYCDAYNKFRKVQNDVYCAKTCNNLGVLLGKVSWYKKSVEWFARASEAASEEDKQRYRRLSLQTEELFKKQYHPPLAVLSLSEGPAEDMLNEIREKLAKTGRFSVIIEKEKQNRFIELFAGISDFTDIPWEELSKDSDIDLLLIFTGKDKNTKFLLYSIKYMREYDRGSPELDKMEQWINRLCITYSNLSYQLE